LPASSVRTVLPLALVTCTSMLAMDFYLPAVPSLQSWFGIEVSLAQATISFFLAALATSQLVWAEIMARLGPRSSVRVGVWLLVVASLGAALAPNIETLIAMRAIQGFAAGAATVVAPSVVRATLAEADAVRGMAAIAMVEAIVPAAGPVLGAVLLAYADWQATFVVVGAATLAALPFAIRAAPRELPGLDRRVVSTYASILSNRRYTRLAVSHALSMGALLTFIASAPQLMTHALGHGTSAFALLQVIGVAAFLIMASQAGRISESLGAPRAVQLGSGVQLVACLVMLLLEQALELSFTAFAVFWFIFCGALAVRGPAAFSEALKVPASQLGRASAMLVLMILLAGAIGTQLVAPFMAGKSSNGLLLGLIVPCVISMALVVPYPSETDEPTI
jgi:DHA1 family bicyclomycin/chloramphenicol resistance-like MFS transporter